MHQFTFTCFAPTHSSPPHPRSRCSAATMAKQRNEMLPGGIERFSRSAIYKKKGAFKKLGKVCSGLCHHMHILCSLVVGNRLWHRARDLSAPSVCVCVCVCVWCHREHVLTMFIRAIPTFSNIFMISRCMRATLDSIWPRPHVDAFVTLTLSILACHTTHSPRLPRSPRQVAPRQSRLAERRTARREPSL